MFRRSAVKTMIAAVTSDLKKYPKIKTMEEDIPKIKILFLLILKQDAMNKPLPINPNMSDTIVKFTFVISGYSLNLT